MCFRLEWDLDTDEWDLTIVDDRSKLYMEVLTGTLEDCLERIKQFMVDNYQSCEKGRT